MKSRIVRLLLCILFAPVFFIFAGTTGVIMISNPMPIDDAQTGSLNPLLSVDIMHRDGRLMDIVFKSDGSGEGFREVVAYTSAGSGRYQARPRDMRHRGETYRWQVTVSDGETSVSETFSFNIAYFIGLKKTVIMHSDCWKYGYIKPGSEKGKIFVTTQRGIWAGYDVDKGWYRTYQRLLRRQEMTGTWRKLEDGGTLGHPFWGYWDGKYHILGLNRHAGYSGYESASSQTFEGFRNLLCERDVVDTGTRTLKTHWHEGVTYTFDEDAAWIIAIDFDESLPEDTDRGLVKYWQWTKEEDGFAEPVVIGNVSNHTGRVALVRHTRDSWYLFVTEGKHGHLDGQDMSFESTLKYFKSSDAGKTWSKLQDTGVPAHSIWSSVSFARYGDNYYAIVSRGRDTWAYYTRNIEDWTQRHPDPIRLVRGMWARPHGTLLNQNALIFTVAADLSGYFDEQYGIISVVPEMISHPEKPELISPVDASVIGAGEVYLSIKVRGPQTYDVSFYVQKAGEEEKTPVEHASGTFAGEDKLLRDGEDASIKLTGLSPGQYRWYAVVRGALLEYYGGEPDNTSDEAMSDIYTFTIEENIVDE